MTSGDPVTPLSAGVAGNEDDLLEGRLRSVLGECELVDLKAPEPAFVLDTRGNVPPDRDGPALGVWRFEFDGRARGGLRKACRRVLARGADRLEVRLVALRDDADHGGGPTIVREGRLPVVPYSLRATVEDAAAELARWPVFACRGLVATGELEGPRNLDLGRDDTDDGARESDDAPEPRTERDARPTGAARSTFTFRLHLLFNWFARALRMLFRHDQWNVGMVRCPIESFAESSDLPEIHWAGALPRHTFRADPFGIAADGRTWVLYEEVDYRDGRGVIVAEEWGEQGDVARREVVLDADVHLSYPYLFRDGGRVYCVPESSDAERAVLFRAVDFPWEWEQEAVLLDGVPAVDSTLFRHGGRWWLFATDGESGPHHVLLAWHAETLLGEWREHAQNPIKVDIGSARPGGTPFRHGGHLYRPAQSGAWRYGEELVLNRVETLTPHRFAERTVRRIGPDPSGPRTTGLHTLSRLGPDRCLVDGNRSRFSRFEFLRRLRDAVGF